ncbi:GroES-like protein [Gloeophyllum trabeum ATCC 11539]|uniref:GroES-like protein n=1 Tax=Gloeophyllum trabeum (strain ATCC 11539 / FP-39264 / Madison 617) TaxID=670483 RepID=S7PZQ1_GLOTA|nr:GroES-like protein [Gloeophyllum trabeum ATCC 11539]EPQ52938.1 GroES-like protein [Gloeophyllum trabeum ATCC 11539]
MSHKAIVFPSLGADLEVISVPTATLLSDYVHVAVEYVGLTPLDVWQGYHGLFATFPNIPGDTLVGTIVAVGDAVTHVAKGDRVLAMVFGTQEQKAAQAIAHVPANRVGKVPANVDSVSAATVSSGLVMTYHTLISRVNGLGLWLCTGLPNEDFEPLSTEERDRRILVWGASSSVGLYTVPVLAFSGLGGSGPMLCMAGYES